ncbi:hypothetical protein [Streptomyces californicus]|uniref:hypothetical protein n=2 Tax=Streptomyces californicus TaxID=67351 RepID=UPI0036F4CB72
MGAWLGEWLEAKRRRKTTFTGYGSHIRVHLRPRIGHLQLDRLNLEHLVEMFEAINDNNGVIEAENEERREQERRATWGKRSRPPESETERMAAERAKLAAMPSYRRVTGAATQQRIRATLRSALNSAISNQMLTFNPASHVELAPGKRPKALLWTPEQVGQFLDHAERDRP